MRRGLGQFSLLILSGSLATSSAQSTAFAEWELARTIDLQGPTNHVQGIDFDAVNLWLTSVDSRNRKGFLREFALDSGHALRSIEIQDDARFHAGGMASDESSLWIPVAEYRRDSTSVIQRRNKKSLDVELQFRVADHIGCIAVTPEYLIGGNWDSREFYVWDHQGNLIRKIANANGAAYQDMKFDPPYIVASGLLADRSGAIDWLEYPSLRLSRRLPVGQTDRRQPFTREAMAIHGDQLLLVPEDEPSRLFVFHRKR
ncbi:MAG: DUF6454 family protein [Acidobacteriia bacterium]|nr:DUF6454 family protein [Terriglobia bacterium]